MKKISIRKKSTLELAQKSRVLVSMDTSQKVIRPKKGKGNYRRKPKHRENSAEE